MGSTTRKTQVAGVKTVHDIKPNTAAGAVIPLKKYLDKAALASAADLIPPAVPPLPPNVKSTDVPISLLPLTATGQSSFYAGRFDDQMHFSASLLKVAAMFAAGQFHADATAFAQGYTVWQKFLDDFNAALKTRITAVAGADSRIKSAGFFMQPNTDAILKTAGFPTIAFAIAFQNSVSRMIVQSDDDDAGVCIRALGYGYISTVLKEAGFFKPDSTGIWLAGTYDKADKLKMVRIACENDHPDAQLTTSRQMCLLMAMIRLGQLPNNDAGANTLMQGWLNEPKTGTGHTTPWLKRSINTSTPRFSILQDKIGFAGLGSNEIPLVYSEGLIIKWDKTPTEKAQVDSFNNKIDPTNTQPGIHLSGEVAVCWQNLLDDLIPPPPGNFDGIIDVINNSISDFLDQKALP